MTGKKNINSIASRNYVEDIVNPPTIRNVNNVINVIHEIKNRCEYTNIELEYAHNTPYSMVLDKKPDHNYSVCIAPILHTRGNYKMEECTEWAYQALEMRDVTDDNPFIPSKMVEDKMISEYAYKLYEWLIFNVEDCLYLETALDIETDFIVSLVYTDIKKQNKKSISQAVTFL